MTLYNKLVKSLTKENVWLYILCMLLDKPLYGHVIAEELKQRYGFSTAKVTIYTTLYRLEREGLIMKRKEKVEKEKRSFYEITEKGKETLDKCLRLIYDTWKKLGGESAHQV